MIFAYRLDVLPENNEANWIDDDVSATDVLHSSQKTVVHGTQDLDELENSKSSILNRMSLFREAEVFVYDTTKKKDQIRATIRCVTLLDNSFQFVLLKKSRGGLKGLHKEEE